MTRWFRSFHIITKHESEDTRDIQIVSFHSPREITFSLKLVPSAVKRHKLDVTFLFNIRWIFLYFWSLLLIRWLRYLTYSYPFFNIRPRGFYSFFFFFFRGVDGYLLAMVSLGRKLFLLKFSVLARVRIRAQCWPW